MKRFLPDTVVGRAILVLLLALAALHAVGYWVYRAGIETMALNAQDRALAERVVSIKRAIANIPDDQERDRAAHALSSSSLEVHWSKVSLVLGSAPTTERSRDIARRLKELVPDLAAEAFRIGFADDGALASGEAESYRHMLLISVRIDDGSWVNFASPSLGTVQHLDMSVILAALAVALAIVVVAAFLLKWVTRPLQALAVAAERFKLDETPLPIDEHGPAEVRRAAKAFNMMRARIQRLVSERTQALAAVSHDLRTPITRLRLRSEFVEDESTRQLIDQDLADMETMIDSTLEFLRGGTSGEKPRPIDIVSVLKTVADGQADLGHDVSVEGQNHALVMGRLIGLKRAFTNIIGNAVKYAHHVKVTIASEAGQVVIDVEDDGPGIPQGEFEKVFHPFYRIEDSRSRKTGGTGLGLTIAQAVIQAHGGTIALSNRSTANVEKGLRVRVSLPAGLSS